MNYKSVSGSKRRDPGCSLSFCSLLSGALQAFRHQGEQGVVVQAVFVGAGKTPYSTYGFPFRIGCDSAGGDWEVF